MRPSKTLVSAANTSKLGVVMKNEGSAVLCVHHASIQGTYKIPLLGLKPQGLKVNMYK